MGIPRIPQSVKVGALTACSLISSLFAPAEPVNNAIKELERPAIVREVDPSYMNSALRELRVQSAEASSHLPTYPYLVRFDCNFITRSGYGRLPVFLYMNAYDHADAVRRIRRDPRIIFSRIRPTDFIFLSCRITAVTLVIPQGTGPVYTVPPSDGSIPLPTPDPGQYREQILLTDNDVRGVITEFLSRYGLRQLPGSSRGVWNILKTYVTADIPGKTSLQLQEGTRFVSTPLEVVAHNYDGTIAAFDATEIGTETQSLSINCNAFARYVSPRIGKNVVVKVLPYPIERGRVIAIIGEGLSGISDCGTYQPIVPAPALPAPAPSPGY